MDTSKLPNLYGQQEVLQCQRTDGSGIPLKEWLMKPTAGFFLLVFLIRSLICAAAAELAIITEEPSPVNFTENGKLTGVITQKVQEITLWLTIADNI
jgi:hypothetical protein